jgi:hypothetical protein
MLFKVVQHICEALFFRHAVKIVYSRQIAIISYWPQHGCLPPLFQPFFRACSKMAFSVSARGENLMVFKAFLVWV